MAVQEAQWRVVDPLEAAEIRMLECAAGGELFDGATDLQSPDPTAAGGVQPATVRAAVLRHLLAETEWAVHSKGVRLRRVRISGLLDLESVTVRCALLLDDCDLDDSHPVALDFASVPLLVLNRCRLAGLSADSLAVTGNLNLSDSTFAGPVVLSGARIGGALLCYGARIGADHDGRTLICHGMNVRLSVHLSGGFTSEGAVTMPRADIGGEFICRNAHLGVNSFGTSLYAPGIRVGGAVYFSGDFTAQGAVQLTGSSIGGQLRCDGARVGVDSDGNSLLCDGLQTGGSVNLDAVPGGAPFRASGAVRLAGAHITGSLTCRGARLGSNRYGNALVADELRASIAVLLEGGCTASGAVRLAGAQIGGQLRCEGIQITGADQDGCSLFCDGIKVGGPAHLDGGLSAAGGVVFSGADIGGLFSLAGARLGVNLTKQALIGDGMRVDRDLVLGEATCEGGILLAGAVIGGSLTCRGAHLGADDEYYSLVGDGLRIARDFLLDTGRATAFKTTGAVRLTGADIAGTLNCRGANINGSDGDGNALLCNGIRVAGSVVLSEGFVTAGAVRLARADIGGSLNCRGARMGSNNGGDALVGDGMKVSRDVILDADPDGQDAFTADGALQFNGAEIVGFIDLGGAVIDCNQKGITFTSRGANVGGSVYLDRGFRAAGTVVLSRSSIGGSVACYGGRLGASKELESLACERMNIGGGVILSRGFIAVGSVSLRDTVIGRALVWEPGEPVRGQVDLEGARAQYLVDDWTNQRDLAYWPEGRLRLAGFVYNGFGGDTQATVEQRLAWIRSQYRTKPKDPEVTSSEREVLGANGRAGATSTKTSAEDSEHPAVSAVLPFVTQPYRQLADVYRRAGQEDEARAIEIALRRDLRRYGNLSVQRKAINWLLDVTIRYGFRTGRVLAGILALYLIVFLASLFAQHQSNLIIPSNLNNAGLHPTALRCVTGYPCFYPAGYAFDLVVPLINIHQADHWQTNGHHQFGWVWVLGTWMATALGWFLATLLVVGYTGLARKE